MKLVKTVKNADEFFSVHELVKKIHKKSNSLYEYYLRNPTQVGKINPISWVICCNLQN